MNFYIFCWYFNSFPTVLTTFIPSFLETSLVLPETLQLSISNSQLGSFIMENDSNPIHLTINFSLQSCWMNSSVTITMYQAHYFSYIVL